MSIITKAGDIATAIAATVPELASAIVDMDKGQKHKAFNASKIEAHHAIIPTTKAEPVFSLMKKSGTFITRCPSTLSGCSTRMRSATRRKSTLILRGYLYGHTERSGTKGLGSAG